jgi:hypothetical protein
MTTAEGNITTLQNIVVGDNSNDKLRNDITALQTLTGDVSKGNAQLRTDLDAVTAIINGTDAVDGLASRVTSAEGKIAAIEGDYLKAADAYIFQCGSASEVDHVAQAQ